MQKIVALVLLRKLSTGGKLFRRWLGKQLCVAVRLHQFGEAMEFHSAQIPSVYTDSVRRNVLFQLQFCVPRTTHRVNRHTDLRLHHLRARAYPHWEWMKPKPLQQGF